MIKMLLLNNSTLTDITVAIIAGNFDRATNPHPHPNRTTNFAYEIRIQRMDISWLRHIPRVNKKNK